MQLRHADSRMFGAMAGAWTLAAETHSIMRRHMMTFASDLPLPITSSDVWASISTA
jgi:hypothetical protein